MLVGAMLSTAAAGSLAACGSGGSTPSSASSSAAPSTVSPSAVASSAAAQPSASAAGAQFTYIVEPFDPGHPARQRTAPASCGSQTSTLAIEQCFEARTENADASIDAALLSRYQHASPSEQAAILAADSAWLSARQPVCAAAYHSGGTIDGINASACLLAESTARLAAVNRVTFPAARLKATDSPSIANVSWFTAPDGSRIGMQATQGDQHGGAVVAWTVIGGGGGGGGFVVSPAQFPFRDGSFTDAGVTGPPNPAGHRVAAGTVYRFSIDYTNLAKDPNAKKPTGTYDYAPGGTPVAAWGA
jgi:uncharacterized protein YecT (DUF1311 family)